MRKRLEFIAAILIAGIASAASAAVVQTTGGATTSVINKSNISDATTSSTTPVVLIATSVNLTAERLITARFSAESNCTATADPTGNSFRIVDIVARNTTTLVETPLNPAVSVNFAFDSVVSPSTADSRWGARAMERSIRLPAGSYAIKVYFYVYPESGASGLSFSLDDWNFRVEVAN